MSEKKYNKNIMADGTWFVMISRLQFFSGFMNGGVVKSGCVTAMS